MALPLKKKFRWNITLGGVRPADVLFFTKHLAIALQHGLTLTDSLEMLYDQAGSSALQKILEEILEIVRSGRAFYDALAEYPKVFTPIYVNLVKTGELAGTLAENLAHLADQLQKARELRQKVRSAMMYPLLILIAVAGLGFSVALFVLPKIVPLFRTLDVELPVTTRALIWIAEVFSDHGLAIMGGAIAFLIALVFILRRSFIQPFLHAFLLKLPLAGSVLKSLQLERFSRTMGTLIRSGVPLPNSLQITADATDNFVFKRAITSLVSQVEMGNPLADAMRLYPALFPKITSRMVGMGEKTGSLEDSLLYLSDLYADEVDNTMKNFGSLIEPFLLIFIGIAVGLVAISILGSIYKITGSLRQ